MFDPVVLMLIGTGLFGIAIGSMVMYTLLWPILQDYKAMQRNLNTAWDGLYILTDAMPGATGMLPQELIHQIGMQHIHLNIRG